MSLSAPAPLVALTAEQMADAVRRRELDPVELVRAHFHHIDSVNPQLNAFVELTRDRALHDAAALQSRLNADAASLSLAGVPVSIKSSIAVAGCKQEAGSPTRAGIRAEHDAPLVARLKRAGAIVIGTTNTPEMLMAYETDNPLYGRTSSPWDFDRTPGGSSGGEAAAIASGMSAGGIGSDGGGSIRVPAHFSGICGLKPTPGRVPASGHVPESFGPFAMLGVVGPMARTVNDLKMLFDVVAGYDPGDTLAAPVPLRNPNEQRVHIGVMAQHPDCPVTRDTRDAVLKAAKVFADSGFVVDEFTPSVLTEARHHWWTLFVKLAGEMLLPIFAGREHQTSTILQYARNDQPPTKEEILAAWFRRDELRLQLFREMQQFPVLLLPVCAVPAPRHNERVWDIDGNHVEYMQAMMYTQWFNLLGNPAMSVPALLSSDGLPIGVQLVGMPYSEESLLGLAALLEQHFGTLRPPAAPTL